MVPILRSQIANSVGWRKTDTFSTYSYSVTSPEDVRDPVSFWKICLQTDCSTHSHSSYNSFVFGMADNVVWVSADYPLSEENGSVVYCKLLLISFSLFLFGRKNNFNFQICTASNERKTEEFYLGKILIDNWLGFFRIKILYMLFRMFTNSRDFPISHNC